MTNTENTLHIYVVRKGWYPDYNKDEHIENLLFDDIYCKTFAYKEEALEYFNSIYMDDYDSGLFPTIHNITVSNPVEVRFNVEETVVNS
jgi:hypothetical protein